MENLLKKYGNPLSSRIFDLDNQYEFVRFSGDSNPIHNDPIAARRFITGECIVHGIHALMWAFDEFMKLNSLSINSFEATFHKPIPLDNLIYLFWDGKKTKLIIADAENIFTTIFIKFGDIQNKRSKFNLEIGDALSFPNNPSLEECVNSNKKNLLYRGNINSGKILFEIIGQDEKLILESLKSAANKLPLKTIVIKR